MSESHRLLEQVGARRGIRQRCARCGTDAWGPGDGTCFACAVAYRDEIINDRREMDAQESDLLAALAERNIYSRGDLEVALSVLDEAVTR
jgi:hypothetical protein